MRSVSSRRGFTLVEALTVISIVGVVALLAIPAFQSQDPTRLDAAAVEVGNVLRYAMSEAARTGEHVLVDASTSGRLRVFKSNEFGVTGAAVTDPLTKGALEVDLSASRWSGLGITPKFMQAGNPYNQLLIGPTQLQACDSGAVRGALQAGSGVALTLGALTSTVTISETTRRVNIPQP